MSYTLNRGVETDNSNNVQRGLLIGLPILALLLTFGSIRQQTSVGNSVTNEPEVIPLVSSAEQPASDKSKNTGSSNDAGSLSSATNPYKSSNTISTTGGTGSYPAVSAGGGYRGISASTETTNQPGILPLNTNLYIPPVNVQNGGKPVATSSGTSLYAN